MWASLLDEHGSAGFVLDEASILAATRCVRLRNVAWLTGEHGKSFDSSRPASRLFCFKVLQPDPTSCAQTAARLLNAP